MLNQMFSSLTFWIGCVGLILLAGLVAGVRQSEQRSFGCEACRKTGHRPKRPASFVAANGARVCDLHAEWGRLYGYRLLPLKFGNEPFVMKPWMRDSLVLLAVILFAIAAICVVAVHRGAFQ